MSAGKNEVGPHGQQAAHRRQLLTRDPQCEPGPCGDGQAEGEEGEATHRRGVQARDGQHMRQP